MSTESPDPTLEERIEMAWEEYLNTLTFRVPPPSNIAFRAGYIAREAEDAHLREAVELLFTLAEDVDDMLPPGRAAEITKRTETWLDAERIRRQKRWSDGK